MRENMSQQFKEKARKEAFGFIIAGIIALFIRTFLFQPFNIPSGSMYPTLMVGDFLFVSKYSYGYSNTAFPFHYKFFKGRLFASDPKHGDVVVFNNPIQKELDFIKRCVGVGGDKIQVKEGVLHINGTPVQLEYVGMYTYINQHGQLDAVKKYKETMPNGKSYFILKKDEFGKGHLDNTPEYNVPEGNFFMMGDNRDSSGDSRLPNVLGFVPRESLIGRAEILFFSTEARLFKHPDSHWYDLYDLDVTEWIPGIRWNRFFTIIH